MKFGGLRKGILMVLLVCILGIYVGYNVAEARETLQDKPNVLFISSYSLAFDTIPLQIKGLQDILTSEKVDLDIEFMDTKRFNQAEDIELFYSNLKNKLDKLPDYEVIVLGDDAALTFALTYQEELFPGIPMVFLGINSPELAREAGSSPLITGVMEETSYRENFDLANRLFPDAEEYVAIVDNTLTGIGDRQQFLAAVADYPNKAYRVINASECSEEELQQELSAIDSDSIVFFLTMFEDGDGNIYSIKQGAEFISAYVNAPVFRMSVGGVGDGLLGGVMVSYEISGQIAGTMVERILEGTSPEEIAMVDKSPNFGYFDRLVIDEYRIDTKLLPKDSIIINVVPGFIERYRNVLLIAAIVLSIILLILAIMLYNGYRIRKLMNQDFLTKLYNRQWMTRRLDSLLSKQQKCSVAMLDIDDFKHINDSLGHAAGDELLTRVSERLSTMSAGAYTIGRFGGDEFLGLFMEEDKEKLKQYAEDIMSAFEEPFVLGGKKLHIHASVGIARFPEDGESADEIIANADVAMYFAKESGKHAYRFFDKRIKESLKREEQVRGFLQEAINAGNGEGFEILYQPQVSAADGRSVAFEALLRLKSGRSYPDEFIPISEKNGMIILIGRIVAEKVIGQMVSWRERGYELIPVAINFSNIQMRDKEYPDYVSALLEKNNISPHLLEVEITESAFLERSEEAIAYLERFHNIGIKLALDDFGTGYSAVSYLNYIPVSKLKMDKSLLREYEPDKKLKMIAAIVNMAHALGLTAVAEGVEQAEEAQMIRSINCDYIQGYYYSRPIDHEKACRYLTGK